MIAGLHRSAACSHSRGKCRHLVAEARGENSLTIESVERIGIGMANFSPVALSSTRLRPSGTIQIDSTIASASFAWTRQRGVSLPFPPQLLLIELGITAALKILVQAVGLAL